MFWEGLLPLPEGASAPGADVQGRWMSRPPASPGVGRMLEVRKLEPLAPVKRIPVFL